MGVKGQHCFPRANILLVKKKILRSEIFKNADKAERILEFKLKFT